jgi:virulence factor Mce-like protein
MGNIRWSSVIRSVRRRPLESFNRTWLGFVALTVVAALVAASLIVKALGLGYTRYTAEFVQAAGLSPGNPVTIAGVEVGTVSSLSLAGDHVDAVLKIRDNIPLGQNTKVAIKVTTILGSRYLELTPDGPGALPHKTIGLAHTEVPYDLQAALQDATTTFDQVDSDTFAQSLTVLGKQLNGMPAVLPAAMANLHTLSAIIADRRDQLGTLLKSSQRVANTLRAQQTNLGQLIDQGQDLVGEFVVHRAAFHALLAALTTLTADLDKIVVNDRPQLDEMLATVHALTDMLGRHDDLFRSLLQTLPLPLRGLTNATAYGPIVEMDLTNSFAVDSWMCAISGRAKQFGMIQYFKDCK